MRPQQWVKSGFVLAPVVFAQELEHLDRVLMALAGAACFSAAASAVYLLNDIVDVESDRAHPVKKNRPIASGAVSLGAARTAMAVLVTIAAVGGYFLHPLFTLCVGSYLVLNVAYSFRLKKIAYVDVLCIAAGFELRVLAGAYAADVPASYYLLIVTLLLSLYLGFGKRMHELTQQEASGNPSSRKVLQHYSKTAVTWLLRVTAVATVATYAVYTLDPRTRQAFGTDYLVGTSVFTLFGVWRFAHLVRHRPNSESPTEEILRDIPFIANFALWVIVTLSIIYLT